MLVLVLITVVLVIVGANADTNPDTGADNSGAGNSGAGNSGAGNSGANADVAINMETQEITRPEVTDTAVTVSFEVIDTNATAVTHANMTPQTNSPFPAAQVNTLPNASLPVDSEEVPSVMQTSVADSQFAENNQSTAHSANTLQSSTTSLLTLQQAKEAMQKTKIYKSTESSNVQSIIIASLLIKLQANGKYEETSFNKTVETEHPYISKSTNTSNS